MDVNWTNQNRTEIGLDTTPPGGDLGNQNAEFISYFDWGINREVIASSSGDTLYFNTPATTYRSSDTATGEWSYG